jgi:hypothetical protein
MDFALELVKYRELEAKKAIAREKKLEKKLAKVAKSLQTLNEIEVAALRPLEEGLEEAKAKLEATNQRMVEFEAKVAARKAADAKFKS